MNRRKDSNRKLAGASDHKLNSHFSDRITGIVKDKKHSKARRFLATALAGFVVFTTTYNLILPAITVELETVDEVGIVLPEEGLIDEAETNENALNTEDSSYEGTGEETELVAEDSSSYQEPIPENSGYEGTADGDISAGIVGEDAGVLTSQSSEGDTGQIINQSGEDAADAINPALTDDGDLSANDLEPVLTLTASSENVDIKLTYPQEVPAGSSVASACASAAAAS